LRAIPCSLCGYDAPLCECRHCRHTSRDPALAHPSRGWSRGILDGLRAVPHGLFLLATTPGLKRFLVPPLVLTLLFFALLFGWAWGFLGDLLESARLQDVSALGLEPGRLRDAAAWLIEKQVVLWVAKLSGWILFLVASSLVALYTFSIAYEAISGPFLDEIQGRLEARWFGQDPRNAIQRPTDIPVRRCAALSTIAALPALALLVAWWNLSGWPAWIALSALPLPFVAAGTLEREYGRWLWWVVRVEGHTLYVSVKASLLALMVMTLFLPLKLVPVVGFALFVLVAGFSTAITLLDIPFSRRQWALEQRLQFMLHNFLSTVAFGAVAGFLFLIPLIGPLLMVPSASIGGLWLVVRLDKTSLRPRRLRAESAHRPGR